MTEYQNGVDYEITNAPAPVQNPGRPYMAKSIISMAFGIASLCVCWFCVYPFIGLIFAFSIVFAALAMKFGKELLLMDPPIRKPEYIFARVGKITGTIGLILSIICIVIGLALTLLILFGTIRGGSDYAYDFSDIFKNFFGISGI